MKESSDKAKEILRSLYVMVKTSDLPDQIPLVYDHIALSKEAKKIIGLLLSIDAESVQTLANASVQSITPEDPQSSDTTASLADSEQLADAASTNNDLAISDAVSDGSANLTVPLGDDHEVAYDGTAVEVNDFTNPSPSSGLEPLASSGITVSPSAANSSIQITVDPHSSSFQNSHNDRQPVAEIQNDFVTSDGVDVQSVGQSARSSPSLQSQLPIVKKEVLLPNAKVNEVYQARFDCHGVRNLTADVNEVPGISIELGACDVFGTPTQSGDFVIRLKGTLDGYQCEVILSLAVIADPKSLWIAKPSDPTAKYAKPDEYSSFCLTDQMLLLGASKRGRSHAQVGSFRDDDYAVGHIDDSGWFYAVVADGAGSASYSRRGSQIVAETAKDFIPELIEKNLANIDQLVSAYMANEPSADVAIKNSLYHTLAAVGLKAANSIYEEAKQQEESDDSFYTTMILTIARKCSGCWFVAGFGIGDGGAGVLDLSTNQIVIINRPDSGDYGGQTRFLQTSMFNDTVDISQRIFFDVRHNVDAIVLMTDGITDPKFPTDNALNDFSTWDKFWHHDLLSEVAVEKPAQEHERQLLNWLDFWSPGNHDDRTIVLMIPLGETDAHR